MWLGAARWDEPGKDGDMSDNIAELVDNTDATGIAAAIGDGEVAAKEIMELAIARVEERNSTLNAVVSSRFEEALAEATELTNGDSPNAAAPRIPFAGVPFVVKDLGQAVAGLPSTKGSRLWADNIATVDTELVSRYRAAGFIPIGMTNSPELGKSPSTEPLLHGPTRNPYNLTRSSGDRREERPLRSLAGS